MNFREQVLLGGWFVVVLYTLAVGCSGTLVEAPSFYVMPEADYSVLYVVTDSQPVRIQTLKFPGMSDLPQRSLRPPTVKDSLRILARRHDRIAYNYRGWITFLSNHGAGVVVLKCDSTNYAVEYPTLQMPQGYQAHASVLVDDVLYVGGACGKEVIGFFDLNVRGAEWTSMEVPETLKKDGKRIDDILVRGTRLIAVDDLVFPKYFLVYDVSDPLLPQLDEMIAIPNHGVYEVIGKAAMGKNWMATLSRTSGQMSMSEHIALFDLNNLEENGSISNRKGANRFAGYPELAADTALTWESIEFFDDLLLIACRDRGVGILDVSKISIFSDFREQCNQQLRYHWPTVLPRGEVLNIIPVPAITARAVIMNVKGELKSYLLSKDEFLQ